MLWQRHAVLRVHPRHLLSDEDRVLLDLWLLYRRDGMGGVGHLPYQGGSAQQPSAVMRALDTMDVADSRVRAKFKT
jgi:hypothetical protein